jgi:hypothetical protein
MIWAIKREKTKGGEYYYTLSPQLYNQIPRNTLPSTIQPNPTEYSPLNYTTKPHGILSPQLYNQTPRNTLPSTIQPNPTEYSPLNYTTKSHEILSPQLYNQIPRNTLPSTIPRRGGGYGGTPPLHIQTHNISICSVSSSRWRIWTRRFQVFNTHNTWCWTWFSYYCRFNRLWWWSL